MPESAFVNSTNGLPPARARTIYATLTDLLTSLPSAIRILPRLAEPVARNNARVNVALFDLKGNRVFSKSYTSSTVLSLNEMVNARGAYIVRVMSGSTLMLTAKVNLH